MQIEQATETDRVDITRLLQAAKLPAEDLPAALAHFLLAREGRQLCGLIGLEPYGSDGLLRSMVVDPLFRNRKTGSALVAALEKRAAATGIETLYLLTETAESYFSKKGYVLTTRASVPPSVLASSEFSHVCPLSATVMKKDLI